MSTSSLRIAAAIAGALDPALLNDPEASARVAAVVAFVPPTDLRVAVWDAPESLPAYRNFPALNLDMKKAEENSPLVHVTPDDAPALVIMGGRDELVPPKHGKWIDAAYEREKVDRKLIIPPYLAISTLMPNILVISKGSKRLILIELTSPCEKNMEARHRDKLEKYASLCSGITQKGLKGIVLQWRSAQDDFVMNRFDFAFVRLDLEIRKKNLLLS